VPGARGRLADAGSLADLLGRHAERHGVPGAAVGLVRGGQVRTACYGVADVRTQRPVTPGTAFSLGSLTKPVVATLLARLARSGALSFDDTVAARVPETSAAPWAGRATLRDLMANRSGLPLSIGLEFGFDLRTDEDDGALARFAGEIATHDPCPGIWSYSNAGWCLLGRAVEVATATTFEQAARHHLGAAGVDGISFATDGPVTDRVCGHDLVDGRAVPVPPLVNRAYSAAGTSATASVEALLDLARVHLADPVLAVLRQTTHTTSIPGWFDAWGLGWARFDWPDGPAWGWDGMINGERTLLRLLPEREAAVVLLANASSGRALARDLLPELLPAAFGIDVPAWRLDPAPGAAGDLSRFAGSYAWTDRLIAVTVADAGLLVVEGEHHLLARPLDGRTFVLDPGDDDGPTVTFGDFGADGGPGVVYDLIWGVPRAQGERP
jgi:CubicO group peptidase (beta-lactamase class C family)